MVSWFLRLFDSVAWLIRAVGADYPQFRAILEAKLTMDTRRTTVGYQVYRKDKDKPGNALLATLVWYAFMGVMIAPAAFVADSALVGLTFVHATVMMMLGLSLVADFSSVLLDTTDVAILHPRPVSGRTILTARIAHIVIYLALLSLSLSLLVFIGGTFKWGFLFPPIFLLTLICSVALMV